METYIAHTDEPLPQGITVLTTRRISRLYRSVIYIRTPDTWTEDLHYEPTTGKYTKVLYDSHGQAVLKTTLASMVSIFTDKETKTGIKTQIC